MDLETHAGRESGSERLRWGWIVAGVLIGTVLVTLFQRLADPSLQQVDVSGLVVILVLLLVGILVGFRSRGETIRETAVSGVLLMLLVQGYVTIVLENSVPFIVWLAGPFFGATLAMAGGWVGELLQGTLEEAHEDRAVDWPWVVASVIIGFSIASYAVFVGRSQLAIGPQESMLVIGFSFLVTGWLVGFFSPGRTMVEPAIAAGLMIVLNAGFLVLWFELVPATGSILVGFSAAVALALLGGWLGELTQSARDRRRERARPRP